MAPTAALIGDVVVGAWAVWYGVVLRADLGPIEIGPGANVQDGSVIHGRRGVTTRIGGRATIGHLCVIHGATVGEEALIGNGCTIQNDAVIGARALVAAGSTVAPGQRSRRRCSPWAPRPRHAVL